MSKKKIKESKKKIKKPEKGSRAKGISMHYKEIIRTQDFFRIKLSKRKIKKKKN